jgi:phosphoserine aminotransferase
MLGARGVDILAWESFGEGWVGDVVGQLKLDDARILRAGYGQLADLATVDFSRDVVFTWNGTTSGVRVPDAEWIAADRQGLTICDATSAAFAQDLDFAKLDVTTFSWQKALGGEAAHGMLVLSHRAVDRLESYVPPRPLPKIFRLTKAGRVNRAIFDGETINTPSMLCVEDWIAALEWARALGGLPALIARADANAAALDRWVATTAWIDHLAADSASRSNTSVCLKLADAVAGRLDETERTALPRRMAWLLEAEGVAYDIASYRDAPPGLRIWCGATVERADIEALTPWLDWAYAEVTEGADLLRPARA